MKQIWKIYDASLPALLIALVLSVYVMRINLLLGIVQVFLVAVTAAAKYLYFKNIKSKLLNKVKTVSEELNFEEGKAFERLAVACSVVEENGDIVWFNDKFADTFSLTKKNGYTNLREVIKKNNLDKIFLGDGARVKVGNLYFSVYSSPINLEDEIVFLLYFFDETKLRLTEKDYYDSRMSVILTVLDNSDEIYNEFKESECASIFGQLEQIIDDWATSYGALCRKFSNARMLILADEKTLQKMIADKFTILDQIREYSYGGKSADITLSIGIGKAETLIDANNSARQAIDMAQSRGGDQVAIKHDAQYRFYGGVTAGFEKKNKVKSRLIAKSVAEIIQDSENVIIMGHRYSDFDSFGAAIGMYSIAKHFGKEVNICIDLKTTLAYALVQKFLDDSNEKVLISPEHILSFVGENTLLIVVDTHRGDFTECPELVSMCEKVMVIDHHRKAVDFIEDTVMFYHMPNSSSACEMVAEISQYVDSKDIIDANEATAMLTGIMLDTRNFIIRSGVRTFEAAAYLKKRGANTVECKKLFSSDFDIFKNRNIIIDKAETYNSCAISSAEGEVPNIRLVTSQAADELINIDGVKASFVLYKNGANTHVSARSYGEINVQLIMEELGGGGHQTMAACQLQSCGTEDATRRLKKAIDNYFRKI